MSAGGSFDYPVGIVLFDGELFPAIYEDYVQLNTFQDKTTLGDYTRDSDQLISAKIWTDFTGGFGIRFIREGSNAGSYEWGIGIDGRRPNQLALSRRKSFIDGDVTRFAGQLGNKVWGCSASGIHEWDETTHTFDPVAAAAIVDVPTHRAEEFNGLLWIPQGDGYQTWDGVTMSAQNTSIQALQFTEWNNQIWCITADGKLMGNDGVSWDEKVTIQSSAEPRTIGVYMDTAGEDVVAVGTSKGLYMWDDYSGNLVLTRLRYPRHPANALGMATWRVGEDLYVTAGMAMYRYTGPSTAPNMGLNADQYTIPAEFRGKIVDLLAEHNGLYALVQGVESTPSAGDPDIKFDPGMKTEGGFTSVPTVAQSMVCQYNGHGWEVVWTSPGPTIPYFMGLTDADDVYRIWWGTEDGMWTQTLPATIINPEELMTAGEGDFTDTGYIKSGNFDAGMRKFQKLASHMEIEIPHFESGVVSAAFQHSIDMAAFVGVPATFEQGSVVIPFGVETLSDGTLFSRGQLFDYYNWLLMMGTTDPAFSPIIDSLTLKFIRRPLKGAGWIIRIPFDFKDPEWRGKTKLDIKQQIDALIDSPHYVRMQHGPDYKKSRRVYISRVGGVNATGDDQRGFRTISVTEVGIGNTGLWDGN